MVFGRKGQGATSSASASIDGYAWVDAHLARYDRPGSVGFAQKLGKDLFHSSYEAMKNERGVQIEAIVAMLASVGGHLCLTAILDTLREERRQPADIGMVTMSGGDGHIYYFGDAPNRLLCEAHESLISLVFGAAHAHGAAVSMDMLHNEMKTVAGNVGSGDFLALNLPPPLSVDSPLNWARHFAGFVVGSVGQHFRASVAHAPMPIPPNALAPQFLLPKICGFALQQAIDVGHQSLDPLSLAKIALSCSLRSAKIDPARVHQAQV